ncbi:MAG: FUSC family protein [Thermodesulfobacteriota bacterium]
MKKLTLTEHFNAFRVENSLKLTLAGIVCIFVNNLFHLDLGYLSTLFVFLILIVAHGETFIVGAQSLIGVIISCVVTITITYLFVDSKILYLLLTGVWIFICMTFVFKFFLPTLVSAIAATIAVYSAIYVSVSDATSTVESYIVQLFIAVVVCWVIDGLVWPHKSRGSFQLTLKTVCEDFSELFNCYTQEAVVKRKSHQEISTSLTTFSDLTTYIKRMQSEERSPNFPIDLYMKIITFSRGIYIKTEVLEEFVLKEHSFKQDPEVAKVIDQLFAIVSNSFSEMAQSIGTKAVVKIEDKELDDSLALLHELYRKMHEAEGLTDRYYEDLLAFGAMLPVLDDISSKLKRITEAINIFHRDEYGKMFENRITHSNKVIDIKAKSFFSFNKETSIVGIKTVIIFLLLVFGEFVVGLPGGGQVAFYAILFGVIPNLGQEYMKSRNGILGIFSGLFFGLFALVLVSQIQHFLVFLSLYSLGTFIAAYFAFSSKDISFAGLQAGLVIPYTMLFNTGPQVDLDEAFTRCMALISAAFIAAIVHVLLWPNNPFNMLKQKISKAVAISGQILSKLLVVDITEKEQVEKLVQPLAATLPTSTSLLHDAEYIISRDDLHAEQFIHIIESIERMYVDMETLKRTVYDNGDSEVFPLYLAKMEPLYKNISAVFDEVSNQFNLDNDFAKEISSLVEAIEQHRIEYRDSGVWRSFKPEDVEQSVLVATSIDSLLDTLGQISIAIGQINQSSQDRKPVFQTKEA